MGSTYLEEVLGHNNYDVRPPFISFLFHQLP